MNYTIVFTPETSDDILNGFSWYESKSAGLGSDFIKTVYECLDNIRNNPAAFPIVYKKYRRALLKRFPFSVYYSFEDQATIVVWALFHCARNPDFIDSSLEKRNEQDDGSK